MKGAASASVKSIGSDSIDDIYVLSHSTPAVQSVNSKDDANRWGPIVKLSAGTRVQVCGGGFNRTTVKVKASGASYFIFREDLIAQDAEANTFRESLKRLRSKLSRKEGHI